MEPGQHVDYIGQLTGHSRRMGWPEPQYHFPPPVGPGHDLYFVATCVVRANGQDMKFVSGPHKKKQGAKNEAAKFALEGLQVKEELRKRREGKKKRKVDEGRVVVEKDPCVDAQVEDSTAQELVEEPLKLLTGYIDHFNTTRHPFFVSLQDEINANTRQVVGKLAIVAADPDGTHNAHRLAHSSTNQSYGRSVPRAQTAPTTVSSSNQSQPDPADPNQPEANNKADTQSPTDIKSNGGGSGMNAGGDEDIKGAMDKQADNSTSTASQGAQNTEHAANGIAGNGLSVTNQGEITVPIGHENAANEPFTYKLAEGETAPRKEITVDGNQSDSTTGEIGSQSASRDSMRPRIKQYTGRLAVCLEETGTGTTANEAHQVAARTMICKLHNTPTHYLPPAFHERLNPLGFYPHICIKPPSSNGPQPKSQAVLDYKLHNAVMAVKELGDAMRSPIEFGKEAGGGDGGRVSVRVAGWEAKGYGTSDKAAKRDGCMIIMERILSTIPPPSVPPYPVPPAQRTQAFAQFLARKALQHYEQMPIYGKPASSEDTVYAAIIMTRQGQSTEDADPDLVQFGINEATVVASGIGTKGVALGFHQSDGRQVNDCHAEVLCRRALVRFLTSELNKAISSGEASSVIGWYQGTWGVHVNLSFHLYTSRSPCGDTVKAKAGGVDNILNFDPSCREHQLLRDFGLYVADLRATHVLLKRSSCSLTCTDKIYLWNALGMQGAALSHFLAPVRLSSVIIGSYVEGEAFDRAMRRKVPGLSPYFAPCIPWMYETSLQYRRTPGSTCSMACAWSVESGDDGLEVISPMTGRRHPVERLYRQRGGTFPVDVAVSSLSPTAMMRTFGDLCQAAREHHVLPEKLMHLSASELLDRTRIKTTSHSYQTAKQTIHRNLLQPQMPPTEHAQWLKKPSHCLLVQTH